AIFNINCDYTNNSTISIFNQIYRKPLVKEYGFIFQVALIKRMKQCMAGTICSSTSTRCLTTLTEILRLTAKGALINTTILSARKWQAHMFQFEHSFWTY